jgi:hypothetical protein
MDAGGADYANRTRFLRRINIVLEGDAFMGPVEAAGEPNYLFF